MEWNMVKISINSFWSSIVSVRFMHNYYADLKCKDFEIIPTEGTAEFLRNHRLLFKAKNERFNILANTDDKVQELLFKGGLEKSKISFFLKSNNKDFVNFSDLPFLDREKVFHFDNLEKNISKEEEKKLHAGDFLEGTLNQQLQLMPFLFSFNSEKPIKRKDLVLTNNIGEQIKLPEFDTDEVELETHRIDIRNYPEGRYSLRHKSKKIEGFDFYATKEDKSQFFGIIDIYIGEAANKDYRVINGKKLDPQQFTIHFNRRSTYWKYYIINKQNNINYKYHEVIPKEGSVQFSKPENVELRNGVPAIKLTSETPIAFMQNQANKFKLNLSKNANGKGNKFSINLPTANISIVKPDKKTKKVYSEIYIYL